MSKNDIADLRNVIRDMYSTAISGESISNDEIIARLKVESRELVDRCAGDLIKKAIIKTINEVSGRSNRGTGQIQLALPGFEGHVPELIPIGGRRNGVKKNLLKATLAEARHYAEMSNRRENHRETPNQSVRRLIQQIPADQFPESMTIAEILEKINSDGQLI